MSKIEKLIMACNDMTEVLGLEPAIEADDKSQMRLDLVEAAKLLKSSDMSKLKDETIATLEKLGVELPKREKKETEKEENKKKDEKEGKMSSKKEHKPEKKLENKEGKKEKKPGVIATIISIVEEKQPISLDKIASLLTKKFPEREEKGMRKTASVQLNSRLNTQGFKVTKDDKGRFSISGKKK